MHILFILRSFLHLLFVNQSRCDLNIRLPRKCMPTSWVNSKLLITYIDIEINYSNYNELLWIKLILLAYFLKTRINQRPIHISVTLNIWILIISFVVILLLILPTSVFMELLMETCIVINYMIAVSSVRMLCEQDSGRTNK